MESNITEQQYFASDSQLSEPHFDEEATLLSARRVVPWKDVPPEPRSGRGLAFVLTIVFAVMVGAIGGAVIYKQRGQKQSSAIVETDNPQRERVVSEDRQLSSAAGGIAPDSTASSETENADDPARPQLHSGAVATESRRSAPPISGNPGGTNERLQNEAGSQLEGEMDERELRRAERREARRLTKDAERLAKREGRGRKGKSEDDLLRIREIFEGSRRP